MALCIKREPRKQGYKLKSTHRATEVMEKKKRAAATTTTTKNFVEVLEMIQFNIYSTKRWCIYIVHITSGKWLPRVLAYFLVSTMSHTAEWQTKRRKAIYVFQTIRSNCIQSAHLMYMLELLWFPLRWQNLDSRARHMNVKKLHKNINKIYIKTLKENEFFFRKTINFELK